MPEWLFVVLIAVIGALLILALKLKIDVWSLEKELRESESNKDDVINQKASTQDSSCIPITSAAASSASPRVAQMPDSKDVCTEKNSSSIAFSPESTHSGEGIKDKPAIGTHISNFFNQIFSGACITLSLFLKLLFLVPAVFVLKFPLWLALLVTAVIAFIPILGALVNIGLWIWAFFVCLNSPISALSVIFYILFALNALDFLQALIRTILEFIAVRSTYRR